MAPSRIARLHFCARAVLSLLALGTVFAWVPTGSGVHHRCRNGKTPILGMSAGKNDGDASPSSKVRFLGKGERAIVRPGVVLLAPTNEYHHYYRQAAIFVHAMGEDDDDVYVIRGVILDQPTPFTLGEMMEHNPALQKTPLKDNLLFRGGDKGGDQVVLLHNHEEIGQSSIGVSGVFQGGFDQAMAACEKGHRQTSDFKLFFNYCEFTELEMEDLLASDEDGDAWISVEVDSDFVLNDGWERGDAWSRLRNAVQQQLKL
ncbi:predicted protein [Phaeodactylum tricornutum CCAP 1055/1]|jgi:putative AlgH/UPF0301 family transcriptional regulator|uniref:Uncharacterized protein n=1 Tax=Phaeodactylum tricornutum (strain CCAP 1055/1) TaxID=556484 RepID=B7GE41_PHATC|nr:predicted protein [Phaeodactylum tricornutum CCAP 1055/1]EEC43037.1 predicted protein [Phaeodactylum tricornutum CCAP 1055/1]|eukprot:XP_002185368.1 predicted protein [Phaeodactylum tricornutum CCAP 1055/1]